MSDSNFSNLQQNQFNKIYRAKTPRRKEKNLLISPNLARFASLRETLFFDFFLTKISKYFWSDIRSGVQVSLLRGLGFVTSKEVKMSIFVEVNSGGRAALGSTVVDLV
jgi:hypothetical protein